MKNKLFLTRDFVSILLLICLVSLISCTKKFEEYNTDPGGVTNTQLLPDGNSIGSYFPDIQYSITPNNPSGSNVLAGSLGEYWINGVYAGYLMNPIPGPSYSNYNLLPAYESYQLFNMSYSAVMSQVANIRRVGGTSIAPDFLAIALILQVAEMHKITDIYGPIPYSKFGSSSSSVPYDAQKDIYDLFFMQLDTAMNNLKAYVARFPGATPFKKFDVVYDGDYSKWIKYANSLRLRLAMHIVKVDKTTARQQAEKAADPANGGLITTNADNAAAKGGFHLLATICNDWSNARAGGAIVSYLDGYSDPRLGAYFAPSVIEPGKYKGMRAGSIVNDMTKALMFSNISLTNFGHDAPGMLMNAAEVNFLLAEGALRGWSMGAASAKELYEAGITASLSQWGASAGVISNYIDDNTSTPDGLVDPVNAANNSPALSNITIKWDEAADREEKLERIITQKWLATFPDCTESWTTFRRTAYPKLFPVVLNNSGGTISTSIQIRRLKFLALEYANNGAEVAKAVTMLGGPDNGGTRLWWDADTGNF